jgi:hypothetical protein
LVVAIPQASEQLDEPMIGAGIAGPKVSVAAWAVLATAKTARQPASIAMSPRRGSLPLIFNSFLRPFMVLWACKLEGILSKKARRRN